MASIVKKIKADGSAAYLARITIKNKGKIFHRESKTFSKHSLAKVWSKRRESEIEEQLARTGNISNITTWAMAAKHHLSFLVSQDKLKRTKRTTIEFLLRQPIAEFRLCDITSKVIIQHLRDRIINDKVKPQTVNNDLAYIGSVMRHASIMLDVPVDLNALLAAKKTAWANGLVARAEKRQRRLTKEEELALISYYENHNIKFYMVDVVKFALASARRQSEITRLRWDDLNIEDSTIKVRDMKHPRLRGYTKTAKLSNNALAIILKQPRENEFIFTLNHKTISTNFTRACHLLEIKNLRFHDLRHEATSRLFEIGYSIVEVQQFTLHEDWSTLKRYTHLKPADVQLRD